MGSNFFPHPLVLCQATNEPVEAVLSIATEAICLGAGGGGGWAWAGAAAAAQGRSPQGVGISVPQGAICLCPGSLSGRDGWGAPGVHGSAYLVCKL